MGFSGELVSNCPSLVVFDGECLLVCLIFATLWLLKTLDQRVILNLSSASLTSNSLFMLYVVDEDLLFLVKTTEHW